MVHFESININWIDILIASSISRPAQDRSLTVLLERAGGHGLYVSETFAFLNVWSSHFVGPACLPACWVELSWVEWIETTIYLLKDEKHRLNNLSPPRLISALKTGVECERSCKDKKQLSCCPPSASYCRLRLRATINQVRACKWRSRSFILYQWRQRNNSLFKLTCLVWKVTRRMNRLLLATSTSTSISVELNS